MLFWNASHIPGAQIMCFSRKACIICTKMSWYQALHCPGIQIRDLIFKNESNRKGFPEYLSSVTWCVHFQVLPQFSQKKREMDSNVNKSDAIWKMGTKGLSSITDFNEDGGEKRPFLLLLLAFQMCSVCLSVHRR